MKRFPLLLTIILTISLAGMTAYAATTTHTYFFAQPTITSVGGQTTVILDGAQTWGRVGNPLLPHSPVQLLLPPGEEAVSISVETGDLVIIGDGYQIPHRQQPYPLSIGPDAQPTPRSEAVYTSDDPFPIEAAGDLQTQFLAGHGIAYAVTYPVVYRPVSGELAYYPWIKVTVQSRSTEKAQSSYNQMLKRTRAMQERLSGMVQNPQMIPTYGPQAPTDPAGWDMLLITTDAFATGYEDYVAYKNRSGIMTTVETVTDIYASYPGIDNQDKIRNCIIEYYETHGITYVFICGDDEQVPNRPLWCNAGYTDHLPGDLYYSGLDGNWNNDGDSYWGEPGEEDLIGEVYVGRSCADTGIEIPNFNNKNMLYQTAPVTSEVEIALMTGEDLGWSIWAWEYKEEIRLGSSNWGYTTVGFPPNIFVGTLYETPGNYWSAMTDLLPLLNLGPNLVNHLGHADYGYVMQFYTNQITDANFTNNGINHNFFIGYSQGCMCGGFAQSTDCILEAFTTIAHGAVAFVGNSRYGWGDLSTTNGPSQHFDRQFFDALFDENITTLGWMNQDSKEDNIWLIPSDNTIRWCYYELNVFGDPTLDVWTAEPGIFYPTYNSVALLGSQTFEVTAISTPGALVTISMDNVVLGQGEANASGVAIVTFDQPLQTLGDMTIMVTNHDMLPYEGTITVIPPSGPYVIYSSSVIEDAVTGNNNAQLDYGESVELTMTVENVGIANAIGVDLTISTTDPLVTITDATEYLGDIGTGLTGTVNNAFAFDVAPEVADEYAIAFILTATAGASTWESYFVIVAHSPDCEYTSNHIDDSATGNNNHNLDPGEAAVIEVTMTNDGSCYTDNLEMTLSLTDPFVTVSSTPVNLGTVSVGGTATGNFDIQASASCPQEYTVTIQVDFLDAIGYVGSDAFNVTVGDILYAPTGPDAYGYTAYDPYDSPEYPTYEWVEISADSGGPGTLVPFINDDQIFRYELPFTFQYYGVEYDTFSVATNGWVAMGIVTEEDYSNSGIPDADGPPNMIAMYWEDLSPQRTNSGKVWIWNDLTENRVIVEYNHIEQYAPTGAFETFQVILYDPVTYPTGTNDGRIKVQYKEMSATAQSEGTIGIENATETDGIQYLFDGDYDVHAHPIDQGFAILYTTPASGPTFEVTLTPVGTPIQIPAAGGSFDYNIEVANISGNGYWGSVWCDVTLPNGSSYGPTLGPANLFFDPGFTGNRDRTQGVPGGAPSGDYTYNGYVGIYPTVVWAMDSFPFTKLVTGDGAWVGEWFNYGESFEEWMSKADNTIVPEEYSLEQNYPNPFNPLTTISFALPEAAHVTLTVFDLQGRTIADLVNGNRPAGNHEVSWDASHLSSGLYFYRIEAEDYTAVRKMVLMK
ncbi:hypothetical protein CEE37_02220 [candidate division LCP-89 bacterium B3_LCP]|uniref:Gingipain R n=1 Tax=candidate division LCP-89 bacterium B3_LCP TaxID=2012998 RepID=A0A532V5P3_UNCL8|nr:MAG: hypothetical protein CEE37_02220 [candidate division LCP-89 bacterium B3_LCP]